MKILSASAIKGTTVGVPRAYPKEGSLLSQIVNDLKKIPGVWIYLKPSNSRDAAIRALRDYYGLDIKANKEHKHEYRIVGEWFGKEYVSYIDKD